jgi:hypothetical protein
VPRAAQEGRRGVRFEIAEGRTGKEAGVRQFGDAGRQLEWSGEIRRDGVDGQVGEVASQFGGLSVEEVLGDVDRNIGAQAIREAAVSQQQADLGGRSGAEFDQRRAVRND